MARHSWTGRKSAKQEAAGPDKDVKDDKDVETDVAEDGADAAAPDVVAEDAVTEVVAAAAAPDLAGDVVAEDTVTEVVDDAAEVADPADAATEVVELTETADGDAKTVVAEVDSADATVDSAVETTTAADAHRGKRLAYVVVPVICLVLALGAAYLKWLDSSVRMSDSARIETIQVAKDVTVKMLSYKPDTVEQDLGAARGLLTGSFRDDYIKLTTEQVIPGSREGKISAVANVPAAASISAGANKAEVLVFVNQSVIMGNTAPTSTASSVKVTLVKDGDRWLVSGFDPV